MVAVRVEAATAGHPDAFDLAGVSGRAVLAHGSDGIEYLALTDGWQHVRLDVHEGTLLGHRHVRLHFDLGGLAQLDAKLLTLRRLLGLWRKGRFLRALVRPLAGLPHRLEALRVADALAAGASHRDIAIAFYGEQRVRGQWHGESDFLLSRIRRRAAEARRMARGGYRLLLKGK